MWRMFFDKVTASDGPSILDIIWTQMPSMRLRESYQRELSGCHSLAPFLSFFESSSLTLFGHANESLRNAPINGSRFPSTTSGRSIPTIFYDIFEWWFLSSSGATMRTMVVTDLVCVGDKPGCYPSPPMRPEIRRINPEVPSQTIWKNARA